MNNGKRTFFFQTAIVGALVAAIGMSGTALAVNPHRPVITNVNPTFGGVSGGTTVTFTGTNLRTPITVKFGANAATGCDFSGITGTSGSFTCDTPASSVLGVVNITVQNHANGNSGTLILANAFTYTCDSCTVSPVSALFEGTPPTGGVAEPNGIVEAGEGTVSFSPTWINASASGFTGGAFTGDLSNPTMPGGTLTTPASHAQYPNLAAGASGQCSSCYTLNATFSGPRPSVHVDATVDEVPSITGAADTADTHTWTIHIGNSFPDEPSTETFYTYVERLVHNQVTLGFGNGTYQPNGSVPRNQMAAFIARAAAGGDANVPSSGTISAATNPVVNGSYNCTNGGNSLFSDVPPTDTFCKHVHYIAGLNVTSGDGSGHFLPTQKVNRTVMAIFLARALVSPGGDALVPDANTGTGAFTNRSYDCTNGPAPFTDVPVGSNGCKQIGFIWTLGVVDGNGNGTYSPTALVTRGQMAKFLVNAFELSINNP